LGFIDEVLGPLDALGGGVEGGPFGTVDDGWVLPAEHVHLLDPPDVEPEQNVLVHVEVDYVLGYLGDLDVLTVVEDHLVVGHSELLCLVLGHVGVLEQLVLEVGLLVLELVDVVEGDPVDDDPEVAAHVLLDQVLGVLDLLLDPRSASGRRRWESATH